MRWLIVVSLFFPLSFWVAMLSLHPRREAGLSLGGSLLCFFSYHYSDLHTFISAFHMFSYIFFIPSYHTFISYLRYYHTPCCSLGVRRTHPAISIVHYLTFFVTHQTTNHPPTRGLPLSPPRTHRYSSGSLKPQQNPE